MTDNPASYGLLNATRPMRILKDTGGFSHPASIFAASAGLGSRIW